MWLKFGVSGVEGRRGVVWCGRVGWGAVVKGWVGWDGSKVGKGWCGRGMAGIGWDGMGWVMSRCCLCIYGALT